MSDSAAFGGVLGVDGHRLRIRVYHEDTDFSGVVYHASYLRFLERGRTEFLRAIGLRQGHMLATGETPLGFVVRRMTIDFVRPAVMDDAMTVETVPKAVGGATIILTQRVLRDDIVLVTAEVKVAAVVQGRARRLPADLRSTIAAFAATAPAGEPPREPSPTTREKVSLA